MAKGTHSSLLYSQIITMTHLRETRRSESKVSPWDLNLAWSDYRAAAPGAVRMRLYKGSFTVGELRWAELGLRLSSTCEILLLRHHAALQK